MANRILTAAGWEDRVRGVVGVSSAYLPDAVLQLPDVVTMAEIRIIKAVTDWATLTGDDRTILESATVYACASKVITSMASRLPQVAVMDGTEITVKVDWKQRSEEIETSLVSLLEQLQAEEALVRFTLAGPQR